MALDLPESLFESSEDFRPDELLNRDLFMDEEREPVSLGREDSQAL